MSLSITRCTDPSKWNDFVSASPQGNVFCTTHFLDAWGQDYELLLVNRNKQIQLGAIVVKRDNQPTDIPFMYHGVLFDISIANFTNHKRVKKSLELIDFLLVELAERYNRISFSLHYSFEDLRSFQWFHYHEPDLGQFKIDLYYTGLLDLNAYPDFESYLITIRQTRRNLYRQAVAKGLVVEMSNDIETLNSLHHLTFKRQGLKSDEQAGSNLRAISTAALTNGFGELMLCRTSNGEVASATLFLYDERCGYYLFGANHPDYRNTNSGTFLLLENIRRCYAKGIKTVDMCGINSPNRGDFKISFNAIPKPYFIFTWKRTSCINSKKR